MKYKYRIIKNAYRNNENKLDYRYFIEYNNYRNGWVKLEGHDINRGIYDFLQYNTLEEAKNHIDSLIKKDKIELEAAAIEDEIIEYPEVGY